MNKQRFLAELRRLLVFMTESDRTVAIEKYAAKFDAAGEKGEAALLERLGSPTKVAITLSRGYVPGQLTAETKQREALKKAEQSARKTVSADSYDPGAVDDDPLAIILRSLDEPDEAPVDEDEPEIAPDEPSTEPEPDYDPDELEEYKRPHKPVYRRQNAPMPPALGGLLLAVLLLVFGVPLGLLALAVAVVWLLPGAAGVLAAVLAAIGALWCISYVADALLLLALGFLILAAALLLLFCGLWLDVRLIGLYIRGVRALCDALLGKKVAVQ